MGVVASCEPKRATYREARWGWLILAVPLCAGCSLAAQGQNAQGARLFQQGQMAAAQQQFQKAVQSDPTNADAQYNLAATYHVLGRQQKNRAMLEQAEMLYNQCLDRNENHVDCHRALAVLLVETGRSDKAQTLLRNWVVTHPQNADARIELARLYDDFGNTKTAQDQLLQAVQLDNGNARAWAALAMLRERNGDVQQALANYQRSLALNPSQPGLVQHVASLGQSITAPSVTVPGAETRTVNAGGSTTRY